MPPITCPHCGVNNRTGSNFCNHCGKQLPEGASVEFDAPLDADPAQDTDAQTRQDGEESDADHTPSSLQMNLLAEQPWLATDDDDGAASEDDDEEISPHQERLITGIQGLLEPLTLVPNLPTHAASDRSPPDARFDQEAILAPDDELRSWQSLFGQEVALREETIFVDVRKEHSLKIGWVSALLALALLIPLLLGLDGPVGTPQVLPGTVDAFEVVQALPENAQVVVLWNYDPSTAGEMDLVVRPVLEHLLTQGTQLTVASLLPTGPAHANALLADLQDRLRFVEPQPVNLGYLPGGAAVLPLLAYPEAIAQWSNDDVPNLPRQPNLALVIAAQAEDVQAWVELVQPISASQVIALTAAGADPILRPYVDSGQLNGLVSGFDGGAVYATLLERLRDPNRSLAQALADRDLRPYLMLQNWGSLAFLLMLLLGNIAILTGRGDK